MHVRSGELAIQPIYQGFASIATCHFQNLANILEAQGLQDARRKICLSWGFNWTGDGVLYGGNRWIEAGNQIYRTQLSKRWFPTWEEAIAYEADLLSAGLPFVAEVDAFELPSPYFSKEHVIHTVTVLEKRDGFVTLLDATNHPEPTRYPEEAYARMRTLACEGRIEPHVLYVSLHVEPTNPGADAVIRVFYENLQTHWSEELATLDAFIEWVAACNEPINVCRVAAEREYLQFLFQNIGEDRPELLTFAKEFLTLSELWYLLHMITVNENTVLRPQRPRMVKLLRDLRERERSLAETVCRALQRELG